MRRRRRRRPAQPEGCRSLLLPSSLPPCPFAFVLAALKADFRALSRRALASLYCCFATAHAASASSYCCHASAIFPPSFTFLGFDGFFPTGGSASAIGFLRCASRFALDTSFISFCPNLVSFSHLFSPKSRQNFIETREKPAKFMRVSRVWWRETSSFKKNGANLEKVSSKLVKVDSQFRFRASKTSSFEGVSPNLIETFELRRAPEISKRV